MRIPVLTTLLLLASLLVAPPPASAEPARGKNAPKKDVEAERDEGEGRKGRWVRLREGTFDFTLQPAEVNGAGGGIYPSFEFLYARPRLGNFPLHLGIAYWGIEEDVDENNSSYFDETVEEDAFVDDGEETHRYDRHQHFSLHGIVARAKLFFSPGFFMNFGLGYRYTRTREIHDFESGERRSLAKEARSLGGAIGLGNRFYLGQTYYIGANWLELFIPFHVLSSSDAEEGGTSRHYNGDSAEADGKIVSFRTLALELGLLF